MQVLTIGLLHLPILCVVRRALAVCLSTEVCSTGSLVSRKVMHILMREKIVDPSYQEKTPKSKGQAEDNA